jgi:hypothetical protein
MGYYTNISESCSKQDIILHEPLRGRMIITIRALILLLHSKPLQLMRVLFQLVGGPCQLVADLILL